MYRFCVHVFLETVLFSSLSHTVLEKTSKDTWADRLENKRGRRWDRLSVLVRIQSVCPRAVGTRFRYDPLTARSKITITIGMIFRYFAWYFQRFFPRFPLPLGLRRTTPASVPTTAPKETRKLKTIFVPRVLRSRHPRGEIPIEIDQPTLNGRPLHTTIRSCLFENP